jgi:hypothetical protein
MTPVPDDGWEDWKVGRYDGLNLRPINLSVEEMTGLLHQGNPVRVILEPGDTTRYEFLIVPLVGQLAGTGATVEGSYAFVPVRGHMKQGTFIAVWPNMEPPVAHFTGLLSYHTSSVIAAFFHCLLAEMREVFSTPTEVPHGSA